MATRHFEISGSIQFQIEGGSTLIPVREVTPGTNSPNLIGLEPDESVLNAVKDPGQANWGNADVIATGEAMLAQRFPNDECRLHTPSEWAAFLAETSQPDANQQALIDAAKAAKASQGTEVSA